MDYFAEALTSVLVIGGLVYLFFLRPKIEAAKYSRIFDSRVLSVIDGLHLSGIKFGCTDFEMRAYTKQLLDKAHSIPSAETLLTHTFYRNQNCWTFNSHTGLHGEHTTFALLCVIDYCKNYDKPDLIAQCEEMLIEAHIMEAHYR